MARLARTLERLKTNDRSFRELLVDDYLGVEGTSLLAEGLRRNTRLTSLSLSKNGMTDAGFQRLAAAIGSNGCISRLAITNNDLSEASGEHAAYLVHHSTSLTTLKLWNNRLGERGSMLLSSALARTHRLLVLELTYVPHPLSPNWCKEVHSRIRIDAMRQVQRSLRRRRLGDFSRP